MPTLKIVITAPLPDDSREAFRDRHEIESAVLAMLEKLDEEPREISVTCEVEDTGGLKRKDKAPGEKRTRGPGRKQAANGADQLSQGVTAEQPESEAPDA